MRYQVGGGEVGVPQNIMSTLHDVIQPDHFEFVSYWLELGILQSILTTALLNLIPRFELATKSNMRLTKHLATYNVVCVTEIHCTH